MSAATATVSERIGQYVASARFEDIPTEVIEQAKDLIVHHLGLAFGGFGTAAGQQAVRVARLLSGGDGPATLIGTGERASVMEATLANTTMMRELRQDDVMWPAGVHPALVTLSLAIALCEERGLSGRDLLNGMVVGYEVMGKVGGLVWTWAEERPRRPIMAYGTLGAAATAAKLLGLDADQTSRAMGYAANSAMGFAEGDLPTHFYGVLSRLGYLGAILAREGGTSEPTIFEGSYGFFQTLFGRVPTGLDQALDGLGTQHAMMGATTKRYPGTALNIVPTQLAIRLAERHDLRPDAVRAVRIALSDQRQMFHQGHAKGPFTAAIWAMSSMPFAVAIALLDRRVDHARYEQFNNPEILRLVDRIEVVFSSHRPLRSTRMEIDTEDGQRFVDEEGDYAFGQHDWDAWLGRDGNALVGAEKTARLTRCITDLESLERVASLTACLVPD